MIITYEIRDIIMILVKKWYVILAITILFGTAAYPLAVKSFNESLDNYNLLTNNQNKADEINNVNLVAFYNLTSNNFNKAELIAMTKNVVDLSNKEFIKNAIANEIQKNVSNFNKNQLNNITLTSLNDLPTIMVEATDLKENVIDLYVNYFPSIMKESLSKITNKEFTIKLLENSIIKNKSENTNNQIEFNKLIIKEPTILQSKIKVIVTGSLLGFALSCFFILAIDFIKVSNKLRKII